MFNGLILNLLIISRIFPIMNFRFFDWNNFLLNPLRTYFDKIVAWIVNWFHFWFIWFLGSGRVQTLNIRYVIQIYSSFDFHLLSSKCIIEIIIMPKYLSFSRFSHNFLLFPKFQLRIYSHVLVYILILIIINLLKIIIFSFKHFSIRLSLHWRRANI